MPRMAYYCNGLTIDDLDCGWAGCGRPPRKPRKPRYFSRLPQNKNDIDRQYPTKGSVGKPRIPRILRIRRESFPTAGAGRSRGRCGKRLGVCQAAKLFVERIGHTAYV